MPTSNASGFQIDKISDLNQVFSLKEQWVDVVKKSHDTPIFLTWEWIETWLQHFSNEITPYVITFRDANGTVQGIAPLMLDTLKKGPLALRRIQFLGSGDICPDHLDIIAPNDIKEALCAELVDYLFSRRNEWDLIDFESLDAHSYLIEKLKSRGLYHEKDPMICPYIPLSNFSSWEEYQQLALSSRMRKKGLRYLQQLMERNYPEKVSYHRITAEAELDSAMDTLFELHHARWKAKEEFTPFNNEIVTQFHRNLVKKLAPLGMVRLYQLQISGRVIATLYCFYYQNILYDYQRGLDLGWNKYSPGRQLIAHIVKECLESGDHEYDLLRGPEKYKYSWTQELRFDPHVLVSMNIKGSMLILARKGYELLRAIKNKLLGLIKKSEDHADHP